MNSLRTLVVTALLAVWSFPAVGLAQPPADPPTSVASTRAPSAAAAAPAASTAEAASMNAREKQAADLQDFRGGGATIYIGSGATLVLLIILLAILI